MTERPIEQLLGTGGDDPGCEAAFEVLDQYVEAVLRGEDVSHRFAQLITHARNCVACREDTEGLLAALEIELRPAIGAEE